MGDYAAASAFLCKHRLNEHRFGLYGILPEPKGVGQTGKCTGPFDFAALPGEKTLAGDHNSG